MDKIDVRRVSKDGQQMLRRQVIAARREGVTYSEIQSRYGVQPGTACAWWRRYQAEGEAVFGQDRRGRPSGFDAGKKVKGRKRNLIVDTL
nr:helix-turn-helix domain-containing protein [Salinisphaera sp.]